MLEENERVLCVYPNKGARSKYYVAVIVNRISDRPFELLQKENIPIFWGEGTVQNIIEKFCKNNLSKITQANLCQGTQCIH